MSLIACSFSHRSRLSSFFCQRFRWLISHSSLESSKTLSFKIAFPVLLSLTFRAVCTPWALVSSFVLYSIGLFLLALSCWAKLLSFNIDVVRLCAVSQHLILFHQQQVVHSLVVTAPTGLAINHWISRRFFEPCSEAKCFKQMFVVQFFLMTLLSVLPRLIHCLSNKYMDFLFYALFWSSLTSNCTI